MLHDATYWVEQLQTKKINHAELADKMNQLANAKNPALNAIVATHFDEVRPRLEKNADTLLRLPFAGLPVPLKMLGQTKRGWPDTAGSRLFKNYRSDVTDNFVKRLEAAGLVPIAQTNAPEFGFKNITDPTLYGDAHNPWNLAHSPGGSSGGAAASVASGIFPLAAASDGGGSIRIPASFCGLIGLKPTRGTMPVGPNGYRGWQGAAINFALTVSMRDTERLYYAMRSVVAAAPYQAPPAAYAHDHAAPPHKLRVAFCTTSPVHTPVSKDAIAATRDVAHALQNLGHTVTEIPYPVDGEQLIAAYYQMNAADTSAMFTSIAKNLNRPLTKTDMEPMTWAMYQLGRKLPAATYVRSLEKWDEAAATMEHLFTQYDLFLSPTTATTAPKLSDPLQSSATLQRLDYAEDLTLTENEHLVTEMFAQSLALTPYTQLANLTGEPAISLPTHVTPENLPLGVQFMAAKGREDLLFLAGQILEKADMFKLPPAYLH